MKKIRIADTTIAEDFAGNEQTLSFREKTEIARSLDKMCVDVIEFASISNAKTDSLLVRTIAPLAKNSVISQRTGYTEESVDIAWNAVSGAAKPRLSVTVPVSPAQMEFFCHMKPKAILNVVPALIARAKSYTADVEFCAVDATRAEYSFLTSVLAAAIEAGASTVTVCDTASVMMPEEFAAFLTKLRTDVPTLSNVHLGVSCSNGLGMALATTIACMNAGAEEIKCACSSRNLPDEEAVCAFLKARGDSIGMSCGLKAEEISRLSVQIGRILSEKKTTATPVRNFAAQDNSAEILLSQDAGITEVSDAVRRIGYDLSEEDLAKVFEAFGRIAEKKPVSERELDAIVATTALQVPPTYQLISYVVNTGNIIPATAQMHLEKDGHTLSGVCIGDGPIDAAFLAIEQIIGHHYELDEFRIQAVTEGREAMGSALVRLRSGGKLYSGNGISTDIVGASIRAYLNALNKIVFEEI